VLPVIPPYLKLKDKEVYRNQNQNRNRNRNQNRINRSTLAFCSFLLISLLLVKAQENDTSRSPCVKLAANHNTQNKRTEQKKIFFFFGIEFGVFCSPTTRAPSLLALSQSISLCFHKSKTELALKGQNIKACMPCICLFFKKRVSLVFGTVQYYLLFGTWILSLVLIVLL
jgi:hypothetical protein